VEFAVAGLSSLNDRDSIPAIAESISRFPPKLAQTIASQLADLDDARIDALLDRYIFDTQWRKRLAEKRRK
jgi:hypothetical protein